MVRCVGMDENVGPLSGKPPTDPQGPRRRAPYFYAGETIGRYRVNYPDVERRRDGSIDGVRDKAARRIIRKAFKARAVKSERSPRVSEGLNNVRALQAQARQLASETRVEKIADYHNGNRSTRFASTSGDTRWARRLFAKEMAIHQPVFVPSKKAIRAMRTARHKAKRAGVAQDAIGALVDLMQK